MPAFLRDKGGGILKKILSHRHSPLNPSLQTLQQVETGEVEKMSLQTTAENSQERCRPE